LAPSRREKGGGEREQDEQRSDRGQAQQPGMVAEELGRGSDQRHQRRQIRVAECRMAAANDEVELIAKGVVAAGKREVGDTQQESERPHYRVLAQRSDHFVFT
jgi:hypothetical protein